MNKKDLMREFINGIEKNNLVTLFIKNLFDYENLNDYNYFFRMKEIDNNIIIDIYDNISENRFNRYVFSFDNNMYDIKKVKESGVFVTYIFVNNVEDSLDKLIKFAYIFNIEDSMMIKYASGFLDKKIVLILDKIIKEPKSIWL